MLKSIVSWMFGSAALILAGVIVLGRLGLYERFAAHLSIGCDDSLAEMLEHGTNECGTEAMATVLDESMIYFAGFVLVLGLIRLVLMFAGGSGKHHD